MENKYVSVSEDKFKKTTTAESFRHEYILTDQGGLKETALFSLRYVSSGSGNNEQSLVVDYSSLKKEKKNTYAGRKAMLYNGKLILIINDNENISLNANNLFPDAATQDFNGKEKVNYLIDKETLDKISNANTLMMQLSGGTESWNLKGGPIIFMARAFSNALYNETLYLDQINRQTVIDRRKEKIFSIGLKIALLMFIAGIVVGISCCSKIEDYLDTENVASTYNINDSFKMGVIRGIGAADYYKSGQRAFYIVLFLIIGSVVTLITFNILSDNVKNTYTLLEGDRREGNS